ncbi:MAG: DUF2225 domain-containing protein [candidate division Zixibacteria bacterium]|nr:DUF2225 domain-containing protein [candidate division Zixibacteria bacterium]
MKAGSPLYTTTTACPVCGRKNKYENLAKGAYTVEGNDTDFMPVGIKWSSDEMGNTNPLLFFIATCENCYYSVEFTEKFKEWEKDAHFKNYKLKPLRETHKAKLNEENSPFKVIGKAIEPKQFPNETAICKFLLGIYQEKLSSHPSPLTMGRFYLRIGWLFRDMKTTGSAGVHARTSILSSLDEKLENMTVILGNLDKSVKTLAHFYKDNTSSLFPKARGDDANDIMRGYFNVLNEILGASDVVKGKIDQIKALNGNLVNVEMPEAKAQMPKFGEYENFYEFLFSVQKIFAETPTNEKEALSFAAENYKKAMETGREIKEGFQAIQAYYLIGELERRIGDDDEARKYFNTVINQGRSFTANKSNSSVEMGRVKSIVEKAYEQAKLLSREEMRSESAVS